MTQIIRQDFGVEDFNRIVDCFLYADIRISLSIGELQTIKEYLCDIGPLFQKTVQSYFSKVGNARYDDLTSNLELLVKKISECGGKLISEERNTFNLFWNEIAEIIKADYIPLRDHYLELSYNYFIFEMGNLSQSAKPLLSQ